MAAALHPEPPDPRLHQGRFKFDRYRALYNMRERERERGGELPILQIYDEQIFQDRFRPSLFFLLASTISKSVTKWPTVLFTTRSRKDHKRAKMGCANTVHCRALPSLADMEQIRPTNSNGETNTYDQAGSDPDVSVDPQFSNIPWNFRGKISILGWKPVMFNCYVSFVSVISKTGAQAKSVFCLAVLLWIQ